MQQIATVYLVLYLLKKEKIPREELHDKKQKPDLDLIKAMKVFPVMSVRTKLYPGNKCLRFYLETWAELLM